MAIKLGTNDISKMMLGSTNVDRAYLGDDLVFPSQNQLIIGIPLNFVDSVNFHVYGTIEYSLDGGSTYTPASGNPAFVSGVPSGDVLVNNVGNNVTRILFLDDRFQSITIHEPLGTLTNMNSMFEGSTKLIRVIFDNVNTSNVTNMALMFQFCYILNEISNLNQFDTSKVTAMNNMFSNLQNIINIDVSSFNTSNVTNIEKMFDSCNRVQVLDVSGFDMSKVTSTLDMFANCSSLRSLDTSNFTMQNVTNTSRMFQAVGHLEFDTISLINADLSNVTDASFMFNNASNVKNIIFSNTTTNSITNKSNMFNGVGVRSLNLTSFLQVFVDGDFTAMFANSLDLVCLTNIDTRSAANTLNMFGNTPALNNPNASEQTQILNGYNYVNTNPCF